MHFEVIWAVFWSLWQRAKFWGFWFKGDTAVLIFRFLLFFPFFLLLGINSRLHFVGKVFLRAFRILGLDERQGRWLASGTRFSWKFSGQCYMFFVAFFSFWYGLRDLFTLHKYNRTKLSLTIKTDDATRGRKDLDLHVRLRGEWVKSDTCRRFL